MGAHDKLHEFGAYQKACQLFDLVIADMDGLHRNPLCGRLVARVSLCEEIVAILSASIRTLRAKG